MPGFTETPWTLDGYNLAKEIATDVASMGTTYVSDPTNPDGTGVSAQSPGVPTAAEINGWKPAIGDILSYIAPQHGDLSGNLPTVTVIGLQTIAVPIPSGTNTVLTYNNGVYSWSSPFISNPLQTGVATLSSGTKTVSTGITITSSSKVFLTLITPSGTLGAHYQATNLIAGGPGTGSFTINSVDTSGSIVTTDNSTLNFLIVG